MDQRNCGFHRGTTNHQGRNLLGSQCIPGSQSIVLLLTAVDEVRSLLLQNIQLPSAERGNSDKMLCQLA